MEQGKDQELQQIIGELGTDKRKNFRMGKDGILRFRERVCVPRSRVLRKMLMDEGHKSRLSIHPGMTKMYKDLKVTFWWTDMKIDVADYVASCLVCQKAKIDHQRPGVYWSLLRFLSENGTAFPWTLLRIYQGQ